MYTECTEKEGDGVSKCINLPQLLQRRLSEPNVVLDIEMECVILVNSCLDFIDQNATTVLQSEEIEDLDYSSINYILRRDTLLVQESVVFGSIVR